MKRLAYFLPFVIALFAAGPVWAQQDELYYNVELKHFLNNEDQPYIEILLSIDGTTLRHHKEEKGTFSSQVAVGLEIKKREGAAGTADYAKQFILAGPEIPDTTTARLNYSLLDVRRVILEPGQYVLTGFLIDRNHPDHPENKFERDILVEPASISGISMSDVQFIRSFRPTVVEQSISKHGYDVDPLVTNSTFMDADSLKIYAEVYNAEKYLGEYYFVDVHISKANSSEPIEGYQRPLKIKARGLDLLQTGFDISKLPSDTYYLTVDIYNRSNQIAATRSEKIFLGNSAVETAPQTATTEAWQNFNLTEKELDYYIPTLRYISTVTEQHYTKTLSDFESKKNFFFNFWLKRIENPADNPAKPWRQYQATVEYANTHFKTIYREGWKTDRGRVMLTYGVPNDVEQRLNENNTYPNEIWKYNRLGSQSNLTFVFYDPDGITGDFPLLHSDKIGENPNPRWKLDLMRRSAADANMDNDSFDGPNVHPFRD